MPDVRVYAAEDLRAGLQVSYEREVTEEDVLAFARLSGDHNPLHVDEAYARGTNYGRRIAHGAFQVGLASAVLGVHLPGERVLLGSVNARFPSPLYFPATVRLTGEISAWNAATRGGQLRVVVQDARSSNTTAEIHMGFTLREEGRTSVGEVEAQGAAEGDGREAVEQRDKLVLLTGASGGLGAHLLAALAEEYDVLALVNRTPLAERWRGHAHVREAQADITAPDLEAQIESLTKGRPLYGVVHAAWPGAPRGSLLTADDAAVGQQLTFGATVTVRLARALFNRPHESGGRFVALGSTAATVKPYLQMGVYSLGKACLEQTIRLLAPELARKRITANAVCPSFIPVGINSQATERQVLLESAATPVGRVCGPEDVAGMIRYLLSADSSFVSGQVLALTGARL